MIQSPRHLFVFVFLCEMVDCRLRLSVSTRWLCSSWASTTLLFRQASPPGSRALQRSLLQARSPMMMFDHLPRLFCWPTCMDSSLRCVLALRSRTSIALALASVCACVSSASYVPVAVPVRFAAHGARLTSITSSVISSASHPLFHDATPLVRSVLSCLFPCRLCTLS